MIQAESLSLCNQSAKLLGCKFSQAVLFLHPSFLLKVLLSSVCLYMSWLVRVQQDNKHWVELDSCCLIYMDPSSFAFNFHWSLNLCELKCIFQILLSTEWISYTLESDQSLVLACTNANTIHIQKYCLPSVCEIQESFEVVVYSYFETTSSQQAKH